MKTKIIISIIVVVFIVIGAKLVVVDRRPASTGGETTLVLPKENESEINLLNRWILTGVISAVDTGKKYVIEGNPDNESKDVILGVYTKGIFRQVLTAIKDRDALINGYTSPKDSYKINNEVLRLYAIAADFAIYLEGGIYRMRHLIEPVIFWYAPKAMMLRQFKHVAHEWPDYMNAVFDYLTVPNPGQEILSVFKPFKTISEFQTFLTNDLIPIIEEKISQIMEVVKNGEPLRVVLRLDPKLLWGIEKGEKIAKYLSPDDYGQIAMLVIAEQLKGNTAYVHYALGATYWLCSYNFESYEYFWNKLAKDGYKSNRLRTITGIFGDTKHKWNNTPSAKARMKYIRTIRGLDKITFNAGQININFLKIRKEARAGNFLTKSKEHFLKGSNFDFEFFEFLFSQVGRINNPKHMFISPDDIKDFETPMMDFLRKRVEVFKSEGPVDVVDRITGESYQLDISRMFDEKAFSDLFSFYPKEFHGDLTQNKDLSQKQKREIEKGGKFDLLEIFKKGNSLDKFSWNYMYSKPLSWPDPTFGGLMPGAQNPKVDTVSGKISREGSIISYIFHYNQQPAIPFVAWFLNLYQ